MIDLLPMLAVVGGAGILVVLLWAMWVSRREGERQAAVRIGFMALTLPLPFLVPILLPVPTATWMAGVVLICAVVLAGVLLVPMPGRNLPELGTPVPGVDERDIMFSRATLVPGSARFEEYYRRRPEKRAPDDGFRAGPGLLSEGSTHYHPQGFAAADAAFWTIERLRPFVEGEEVGEGAGEGPAAETPAPGDSGMKLGGEGAPVRVEATAGWDAGAMSRFLKAWAMKMGAHSVGVTELRPYHLYTHVGRGPDYGSPVELDHPFALALTVEMDKEMVDRAPRSPTAMESALQYLRSGVMAVQIADLIRRLGYSARAHVDGNYRVICPLVARDAGLGELGRMGLLMTPRLGPRVRISVVTTDLPLQPDGSPRDLTVVDFCIHCMKCAEACPSHAIPFDQPREDADGVVRWQIDSEACFTLWGRLGTDCARCMAVCPYSHPDNALHAWVRAGIRNNRWFRRWARWIDDLLYDRRPPPKDSLAWMEIPEAAGKP